MNPTFDIMAVFLEEKRAASEPSQVQQEARREAPVRDFDLMSVFNAF